MVVAKKFVRVKTFEGFPKSSDVRLEQEELPPIKNNEYLTEALYVSVDPYMRGFIIEGSKEFFGSQVARIIESKNDNFPVGRHVLIYSGWRTHTVINPEEKHLVPPVLLPENSDDLPLFLYLGILGMPGNTAYFGFLEICQPKACESVVVSGAAGAVGSHVGQIAKIKGCKVIGIAGSDEKGKWLTKELGFDHFINYKSQNVETELKKLAPEGFDCYFDNVGGEISVTVFHQMKKFGRVSVCGSISGYNSVTPPKVSTPFGDIVRHQLKVEGFVVDRWSDRRLEGVQQNLEWIKQGKLQYRETVTNGFGNTFKAFVEMLQGGNIGKAVVKV